MRPSAATLARGRALNAANLPDTAVAYIPTPGVDDGAGGTTPGVPDTLEFACRVVHPNAGMSHEEVVFAEMLKDPGSILLAYATTVDLPATAQVTVYRAGTGTEYEVVGLVPPGSYSVLKRAILKLKPEGSDS